MYVRKISAATKQKAVAKIELGRLSQREVARRLGWDESTIRHWLSKYRSEGNSGLESDNINRKYYVQTKQEVVGAYLTGKYSQEKVCEIFKIRDRRLLRDYLKVYKYRNHR